MELHMICLNRAPQSAASRIAHRPLLRLALGLSVALLVLNGCSGKTKSKDNVAIPKVLTEITESVSFTRVWAAGIKTDNAERGERVGPDAQGTRVYVAGGGEVRAIDLDSGKVVWSKAGEQRYSGGPASDGKRVIAGTLDGNVLAFDATDGESLWQAEVSSEVLAKPVFANNLIIVCSNDGRIVALDASTGKSVWKLDRDVPLLSLRGTGTPVVEGDTLFVPGDSGKVMALNVADGALRWEQSVNVSSGRNELERVADIDGGMVVASGDLFVSGYNGQTSAVTASAGSTLWTYQGPSVVGLIVDDRHVYLTNSASEVIALDRRSGAELWKQDALQNRFVTKPAIVNEKVVVGDLEGYLHALNIETGVLEGRTRVGKDGFASAPVVRNDLLIAQTSAGAIAAYRVK
jgi:outer membrane protein assembly factor BamB